MGTSIFITMALVVVVVLSVLEILISRTQKGLPPCDTGTERGHDGELLQSTRTSIRIFVALTIAMVPPVALLANWYWNSNTTRQIASYDYWLTIIYTITALALSVCCALVIIQPTVRSICLQPNSDIAKVTPQLRLCMRILLLSALFANLLYIVLW